MLYKSGVIVLVISNHPCAMQSADLKFLPELSYYHYSLLLLCEFLLFSLLYTPEGPGPNHGPRAQQG